MLFRSTCLTGAEEFRNSAGDEEGYINLLRLFEHQDEMYFDICHYTERGHEIIADKVFEKIYPVLQDKRWNMTGKEQSLWECVMYGAYYEITGGVCDAERKCRLSS